MRRHLVTGVVAVVLSASALTVSQPRAAGQAPIQGNSGAEACSRSRPIATCSDCRRRPPPPSCRRGQWSSPSPIWTSAPRCGLRTFA